MATRKKLPRRKAGVLIDVARVISVGRDRTTGQAVLRFRDEQDRIVALRLRPQQLRTLPLTGPTTWTSQRRIRTAPRRTRRSTWHSGIPPVS